MQVITEYVNKKVDEKAKEILPAEYRNINRRHAFSVLCLIQCASIVVFVYFTYQAYTQQITSVFLALDKTSGICKDVAKPITNEFYASHTGFWSGTDGYKQNEGLYRLQFSNLFVDNDGFASIIQQLHDQLKLLGQDAQSQVAQYNALRHFFYSAKLNEGGYIQKLDFLAEPQAYISCI